MYRVIQNVDSIKGSNPVYSMSIINPKMCKNSSIRIELNQNNEGPIPHVHVYTSNGRGKDDCVLVRLDKAEYSTHHNVNHDNKKHHDSKGKVNRFTKSEKEEFINIMTSIWRSQFIYSVFENGDYRPATGYEAAVSIWIETFGETVQFEYDDEGYPVMPDYNQL